MPSDIIQWFPGHMAKTRRMIKECLPLVDVVIEILDARIPGSSKNPESDSLIAGKPRLFLLSKASLASAGASRIWKQYYESSGAKCIVCDFVSGQGMNEIAPAVKELVSEKLERYKERGMAGKSIRAMVIGIPNVGKSSFINKFSGTKKAKVENRPGVTLDKQWVTTPQGIDLLDMPGVLWPKFEDRTVGENLAITGAIKDVVLNTDEIAIALCGRLRDIAPDMLCARYKLKDADISDASPYEIFEMVGRKRGFLVSGGEVDADRTASTLLDEFRSAKIGRITLEMPPKEKIKETGNDNAEL